MKLLVAFDGSPAARRAVDEAVKLSRKFEGTLILAYVVPPMMPVLVEYAVEAVLELQEELRRNGEQLIGEVATKLRAEGLRVETVVKEGLPAERLAELAMAPDVGYVVVGSSGHGAVARALLGGVVTKLLHLSPKPVVVVR